MLVKQLCAGRRVCLWKSVGLIFALFVRVVHSDDSVVRCALLSLSHTPLLPPPLPYPPTHLLVAKHSTPALVLAPVMKTVDRYRWLPPHVVMIAAGTGIAPMLQTMDFVLSRKTDKCPTDLALLYAVTVVIQSTVFAFVYFFA